MLISQLFEDGNQKQLLVVYPGRFQPFHKGHKAVYDYLCKKFGFDNVFIATSDKVAPPKSPFNFREKLELMKLTGINPSRVVQTTDPYKALELTSHFDPSSTVILFAVSEKDMTEDPRFKSWKKKDGSPTYFQPAPENLANCETFDKHGYILTVPTFNFNVLGQPMRSASEFRANFAQADDETKKALIKDLFGKYTDSAMHLMSSKIHESMDNFAIAINESIQHHVNTGGEYQSMPNWELLGHWNTFKKLQNSPIGLVKDIRQALLDEIKRRHLEARGEVNEDEEEVVEGWKDSLRKAGAIGAMGVAAFASNPQHMTSKQMSDQTYRSQTEQQREKAKQQMKNVLVAKRAQKTTRPPAGSGIPMEDIDFNKDEPMNPMVRGVGNSVTLNGAKIAAAKQIADLNATLAGLRDKNNFDAWDVVTKQFDELKRNIDRIKHGQEELQKVKGFNKFRK